jgi:hypothetical protein
MQSPQSPRKLLRSELRELNSELLGLKGTGPTGKPRRQAIKRRAQEIHGTLERCASLSNEGRRLFLEKLGGDTLSCKEKLSEGQPVSLVFLDIDGVLLPFGGQDFKFPQRCLDALAKIIQATKAVIVLSSTWRSVPEMQTDIIQQFLAHGSVLGNLQALGIEGGTFALATCLVRHSERQWEIADFLRSSSVPIRSWVCLDDEELLLYQQNAKYRPAFEGHVVKTDSRAGLTDEDADQAIAILEQVAVVGSKAAPPRRGRHDRKPSTREAASQGGWSRGAAVATRNQYGTTAGGRATAGGYSRS